MPLRARRYCRKGDAGVMTFYIKGTPGAAQLKVALCGAVSLSQVREILFDE